MQQPSPWSVELGVGIGRALYRLCQAPYVGPLIRVYAQHIISGHCIGHGRIPKLTAYLLDLSAAMYLLVDPATHIEMGICTLIAALG